MYRVISKKQLIALPVEYFNENTICIDFHFRDLKTGLFCNLYMLDYILQLLLEKTHEILKTFFFSLLFLNLTQKGVLHFLNAICFYYSLLIWSSVVEISVRIQVDSHWKI